MTQKNDGGQAYPAAWGNHEQGGDYIHGMSLRDWFAAQALAGIAANSGENAPAGNWPLCASDAYKAADAMLAARDKD